mmetsp:Transcript_10720/g.19269  ORF Transcript_10720/g.19269 Transcript_10720/m.19269 type:complete len:104 (-) Transcript_10720:442-753(-)
MFCASTTRWTNVFIVTAFALHHFNVWTLVGTLSTFYMASNIAAQNEKKQLVYVQDPNWRDLLQNHTKQKGNHISNFFSRLVVSIHSLASFSVKIMVFVDRSMV